MVLSRRIGVVVRHLAPTSPEGTTEDEPARVGDNVTAADVSAGATPLLSAEDWKFWEEEGYLVIPDAVPLANCEAVRREMFETLGASEEDPNSWYEAIKAKRRYQMFTTQGIWDNRSYPKVHRAFSELWGTEKLWVSFDGVGMKLPDRPDYDGGDGFMHWDLSEEQLRAGPSSGMRVQAVLMLADTPENGGTFQCIPRFHRVLEDWVAGVDSHTLCNGGNRPSVPKMDSPTMTGFKVKKVGGQAGTLVIWNSFLPHGNSRNSSGVPRLCQCEFHCVAPTAVAGSHVAWWRVVCVAYCLFDADLTMFPPSSPSTFKAATDSHIGTNGGWSDEVERQRRVKIWELGLHVASFDDKWDPARPFEVPDGSFGGTRTLHQAPAPSLTPLGERLLGKTSW